METPNSLINIFRASTLAIVAILIAALAATAGAKQSSVPASLAPAPTLQTNSPSIPPATAAPVNSDQTIEVPQALHLLVGRSLVISSPARIKRISLADPAIAEAVVVSPNQVVLSGKTAGGTSFILWDEGEQNQN